MFDTELNLVSVWKQCDDVNAMRGTPDHQKAERRWKASSTLVAMRLVATSEGFSSPKSTEKKSRRSMNDVFRLHKSVCLNSPNLVLGQTMLTAASSILGSTSVYC